MDYKKLNKKGMTMSSYLIVLVLFGLVAGVFALVVNDMADDINGYDNPNITDSNFDSAYNKVEYTSSLAEQMGNETISGEGLSLVGSLGVIWGATTTIFSLVFGSFSMVNSVFASFVTSFGIPAGISNLIFPALISILLIIIVFNVLSSLTNRSI